MIAIDNFVADNNDSIKHHQIVELLNINGGNILLGNNSTTEADMKKPWLRIIKASQHESKIHLKRMQKAHSFCEAKLRLLSKSREARHGG